MKEMKMSKDKKQMNRTSRRNFLRGSAVVGTGAVAVVAMPATAVAAAQAQEVDTPTEDGYRLTQHIADYYKSTIS
jgi:hypothetical protein